jgi:hypothetical protein
MLLIKNIIKYFFLQYHHHSWPKTFLVTMYNEKRLPRSINLISDSMGCGRSQPAGRILSVSGWFSGLGITNRTGDRILKISDDIRPSESDIYSGCWILMKESLSLFWLFIESTSPFDWAGTTKIYIFSISKFFFFWLIMSNFTWNFDCNRYRRCSLFWLSIRCSKEFDDEIIVFDLVKLQHLLLARTFFNSFFHFSQSPFYFLHG